MPELVLLTGILISGLSLYLMIRTEELWGLLQRVFGSGWLYGAALLRLLLGAMLIASAPTVAYATAVEVFGWLFCIGGLSLVVLPRSVLQRMVGWFSGLSPGMARLWLSSAVVFGLFFIFAYFA
jgi:hypothetical protein